MAISTPSTAKPPGGMMNTVMGSTMPRRIGKPSRVPAPKSSRMADMRTSVRVKPAPMPRPSSAASFTGCFEANTSARPSTMQFTTISGR